jgi:hypothetical protein
MNVQRITAMSEVRFNLKPVEEKPSRRYRKGSKYDPILDAFLEGEEDLVEVNVSGKDANYLRTQLTKRIDARNLKRVKVSVVNDVCYLEKT